MQNTELLKYIDNACRRLNTIIPCKSQADVDKMNDIIKEMSSLPLEPKLGMYWHRNVYIDCDCNDQLCRAMLICTDKLRFAPTTDMEEHPGVEVKYK